MMLFGSFAPVAQAEDLGDQLTELISTLNTLCNSYYDTTGTVLSGCEDYVDVSAPSAGCTTYAGIPEGFTFNNNLKYGMSNDEVKYLQIILKDEIGAPTYPDSVGATGWFGPITKSSVIEFQEKYADEVLASWGLTNGTGFVGQTTRDKLNELLECVPTPPTDEPSDYDNEADCDDAGYYWYDDACHANEQPADEFDNEADCEDAGYYWYDDQCNEQAQSAEGELTVELSDDTPASNSIPKDAQSVEFLKLDLTAESEDVTVDSITFTRTGTGSRNDFDNVWLEKDGMIIADARSINSSNLITLYPHYTIDAGETVTFSLMADLSGTAAHIDAFQIADEDDIDASVDAITGDFPLSGNAMSLTSYVMGTVTFASAGASSTVDIGDEQKTVGEFTIKPASSNNNDFVFRSIRLKETGTAGLADLDNIALYDNDGEVITDEYDVDGNYLTFPDVDYDIEDGDTVRFTVRADIISGDDGQTIILKLNKNYELFVEEIGFGGTVSGAATLHTYTFNAGKFSVVLDDSSPSNQEVAPDTQDVVGLIAKMNLDQDVTVDGIKVYLDSGTTITGGQAGTDDSAKIDAEVEDVKLYVNDSLVDSVDTITPNTGAGDNGAIADYEFYYDFSDSVTLSDDDLLKVTFDVKSGATSTDIYKFEIVGANSNCSFSSPEYVDSGESVATTDKSGIATGRKVTISSATIAATRNDGYPANHKFIAGASDVKMFQFVMEAGVASAVKVQKLDFNIVGIAAGQDDYITNVRLMAGDEQLGDIDDFSNTYVRFESLNHTIPAGTSETLALYADIGSSMSADTSSNYIILDASDSLFYDKEDNTVTMASNATSTDFDIATGGTLTVAADASPTSNVLTSGTDDNLVGSWTFSADDDAIEVTDLWFVNDPAATSTATTTADSNIEGFKVYIDGEQHGAKVVMTSGGIHFGFGSTDSFTVPKDGNVTVELKADLNEITTESNTNKRLEMVLWSLTAEGSNGTQLSSVSGLVNGDLNGATYSSHANSQAANEFVLVKAKPTLATNASKTDAGSKPNGTKKIYAFDVTAPDEGAVSFKKVVLSVSGTASTTAISNTNAFSTYVSTSTIYRGSTAQDASITVGSTTVTIVFDNVQTVSPDQTATYVYEAQLQKFDGSTGSTDYIDVNIQNLATSYTAANTYASTSASTASFYWTDNSGTYQSTTDSQWMTDYLFGELALDKVELSY